MSLLKNVKKPVVNNGQAFNVINGNDAEVLAASRTVLACGAEISWGSRNEDGRKIDLFISLDHPWERGERIICLCQVKSGPAFGRIANDGFLLTANAKSAAQRTSHSICIIWVDRTLGKTFWAYIHPETLTGKQFYGKNHAVTPAMPFDLARCQARSVPYLAEGSGIILAHKGRTLKEKRKIAQDRYQGFKLYEIKSPNLGLVEFSRVGWRHMFRKGRSVQGKMSSLLVIPYLDKIIITYPTATYISRCDVTSDKDFTYRSSEYVLSYEKVKIHTGTMTKVVVRLLEEIRYPSDWAEKGIFSQLLDRKLILLSCYHK